MSNKRWTRILLNPSGGRFMVVGPMSWKVWYSSICSSSVAIASAYLVIAVSMIQVHGLLVVPGENKPVLVLLRVLEGTELSVFVMIHRQSTTFSNFVATNLMERITKLTSKGKEYIKKLVRALAEYELV
jgi:hypothetical protein